MKGINKAGAWAGMVGGFLTALVPVAVSGFKTPNGPLYACLAMAVSLALCFLVSVIAKRAGWKSGETNDFFLYRHRRGMAGQASYRQKIERIGLFYKKRRLSKSAGGLPALLPLRCRRSAG